MNRVLTVLTTTCACLLLLCGLTWLFLDGRTAFVVTIVASLLSGLYIAIWVFNRQAPDDPGGLLWREEQRRRRRLGLCLECGYDLRGNESGVCSECGSPIKHSVEDADCAAEVKGAHGKALLWVLSVLAILIAVGMIGPLFTKVRTSGPPTKKAASWVEWVLRETILEAQDDGGEVPRNASEFEAMISSSDSGFLLLRSVIDCEDVSPGVVLIRIDTPPGDFKALQYERHGENEYQVVVVPLVNDENGR